MTRVKCDPGVHGVSYGVHRVCYGVNRVKLPVRVGVRDRNRNQIMTIIIVLELSDQ